MGERPQEPKQPRPAEASLWPAGPVLLLDCLSVLFRALFALPPLMTSQGVRTAGIYGMSALLLKLLREHHPAGLLFAVDAPGPTFRHARLPGYKGNRPQGDHELGSPTAHLDGLAEVFAAPLLRAPGFEADDVLATCVRHLEAAGRSCLVVSGDRDLLQLARGSSRVLFIGARGRPHALYDEAAVRRRFGVAPEALPTYVALVGDPSDSLPGIAGVGPKRAAELVSRLGDAAAILARLHEVSSGWLRQALSARAEQLLLVEQLARLRVDVPVRPAVGAVSAAALQRLSRFFESLELRSLLPRLSDMAAAPP